MTFYHLTANKMGKFSKPSFVAIFSGIRQFSTQVDTVQLNGENKSKFPVLNILPYSKVKREKRAFLKPEVFL